MRTTTEILKQILQAVRDNENDLNNIPIEPLKGLINEGIEASEAIINVKFPLVLQPFDGFEVHPCKQEPDGKGGYFVEQCEPTEAHFWSAYYHLTLGGVDCVADFATQEQANSFISFLESAIRLNRMQKPIRTIWPNGTKVMVINEQDEHGNFGKELIIAGFIQMNQYKGGTGICYVINTDKGEITYRPSELKEI